MMLADKTYVRRRLGEAICEGYFARCKAAPAWRTLEIPCGHDVMVDMPERLAEVLQEVAWVF
jgi:hypothetical protein